MAQDALIDRILMGNYYCHLVFEVFFKQSVSKQNILGLKMLIRQNKENDKITLSLKKLFFPDKIVNLRFNCWISCSWE